MSDFSITLLRKDVRLSVDGVVIIPDVGWMHPYTFRAICGGKAYEELLRRPRVENPYAEGG